MRACKVELLPKVEILPLSANLRMNRWSYSPGVTPLRLFVECLKIDVECR